MDRKALGEFLQKLIEELDTHPTRKQAVDSAVRFWKQRGVTDEAILDWLTERLYYTNEAKDPNVAFIDDVKNEIAMQELTEFLRKQGLDQPEINEWLMNLTSRHKQ
ncbi:MAG: hypothetical protein IAF08_12165 [Rhizobacter sp.]|nr:hypothetical protein [Chlorobiales bacterium]